MRLYQPMLYVGLGGTGCQIGIELERRLRDELCGPDGTALQQRVAGMLPFQLPGFTQFVYADLNEVELTRVRRQVVSGEEHAVAAAMTQNFAQNLVPRYRTYPEVARSLRTNASTETAGWLPPPTGEPRVSPLVRGAGQLPTVGRAALFETFRHGFDAVRAPLSEAIGRISKSGGLLTELGGKIGDTCNVFVGFSVAGGTGAGIYYDFLHLIGNELRAAHISPQIYPLVLMPSAFEDGRGGGRRARLNAATGLLDLFRLIDDQNARGAANQLGDSRRPVHLDMTPSSAIHYNSSQDPVVKTVRDSDRVSVTYPDLGEVQLDNSVLQTAFLFCRTVSVDREDLHRSIVSFMLSLVGTELDSEDEADRAAEQMYQSFADGFINEGVERQVPAFTGVGRRPVSTSLVASMTVPVDELADIISARILARAVEELAAPPAGQTEQNRSHIEQFYASSGLDDLRMRITEAFSEPPRTRGSAQITQALRVRIGAMDKRVSALPARLRVIVPQLAREFDYRRGLREGLAQLDPLRLRRVVVGSPQASEPADQLGFLGSLESRRVVPPTPQGLASTPPTVEPLHRHSVLRQLDWTDQEVKRILGRQDLWYRWRTESAWNAAWGELAPVWDPKVSRLRSTVNDFADAFVAHARAEPDDYDHRTADLHRPRSGVSYLVPDRSDFEQFYNAVLRRFIGRVDLALRPNASEAEIVTALLGADGWQRAFDLASELATENRYEQAVLSVRDLLKQQVKILFKDRGPYGDEQPLLPPLRDRLAQAAGKEGPTVAETDVLAFQRGVAGLLPMSYVPEGTGQLKILVAYPQAAKDSVVERYLAEHLNLPNDANAHREFRAVDTESVMVVLLRTSMGITEVPELRSILRHWSEALNREQPQDFIRWRQRVGYNYRWLATTREDRVLIMHRVLCAMWNGQVRTVADRESPHGIVVRLPGDQPVEMVLRLDPYGRASSWASLLRAYEEWTFADSDQIRQDFCQKLMETLPNGLFGVPQLPDKLFTWFVDELAPSQVRVLQSMMPTLPVDSRAWAEDLLDFWTNTVPAAQATFFTAAQNAVSPNLAELKHRVVEYHQHGGQSGVPIEHPGGFDASGYGFGGPYGDGDRPAR